MSGVIVHNVGTAYAVHRALRHGEPLIRRIVTVAGGAVAAPRNVEVLIGTPLSHLLAHCGGLIREPVRTVMGGPMMGIVMPSHAVPVSHQGHQRSAGADRGRDRKPRAWALSALWSLCRCLSGRPDAFRDGGKGQGRGSVRGGRAGR